ncbi:hypothetical protein GCM10010428_78590 [Actinosynnema pretiosum subsp. pretiosum]
MLGAVHRDRDLDVGARKSFEQAGALARRVGLRLELATALAGLSSPEAADHFREMDVRPVA